MWKDKYHAEALPSPWKIQKGQHFEDFSLAGRVESRTRSNITCRNTILCMGPHQTPLSDITVTYVVHFLQSLRNVIFPAKRNFR